MRAYIEQVESPAGLVTFAVDEDGALIRLQFMEGDYATAMEEELEHEGFEFATDERKTARVRGELERYLAGELRAFELPLAPVGSPWQREVWGALTRIPFGETRSYGEIADELGRPGAARAVGRANATNPVPLVVPCHRVIGADGTLTGFGGGMHLKVRLLEHERRVLAGEQTVGG
jgi:methylated-DNA-[protein]-cysteine S-methyltransferase